MTTTPDFQKDDVVRYEMRTKVDLVVDAVFVDGTRRIVRAEYQGGATDDRGDVTPGATWTADERAFTHITPTAEHADGNHRVRIDSGPGRHVKGVLHRRDDGAFVVYDEMLTPYVCDADQIVLVASSVDSAPVAPEPAYLSCGHRNHGAADHDCTPFTPEHHAVAPEPPEQDQPERWYVSGLTDVLVRDDDGEVVAMFRCPTHAARAVADHNETAGLRAQVEALAKARREAEADVEQYRSDWLASDQGWVTANGRHGRAQQSIARLKTERDQARAEACWLRKTKWDVIGSMDEARRERDEARAALAAAPGVGRDLPKVEVVREKSGLLVAELPTGDRVLSYVDDQPEFHRNMVAAHAALLAEREREAAQAQAPAPDEDPLAVAGMEGFRRGYEDAIASLHEGTAGPRLLAAARTAAPAPDEDTADVDEDAR